MWDILTNISLLLTFFDLFVAMSGNGMLESMLEPHLKAYGAGTSGVGMTFTIFGICYVVGNILFERVSIIKSGPSILILSKFHAGIEWGTGFFGAGIPLIFITESE